MDNSYSSYYRIIFQIEWENIMEIIVAILVLMTMVSIIIVSYGKQQEKHRRMQEWMKEVKRNQK